MPLTAMQPTTRRPILLGSAVVMFLAVSVLRFQLDGLEVPLSMLYVFPIAIVALEYDVLGGLLSSVAASAVFVAWLLHADHGLSWAAGLRVPILITVGLMIGWLSRRRRRETAIIRAVLGALPEPASVKDMSGRYRFVNPALERVLELSDTEVVGRTASGLQPATVAARVDEGDRKVIETLRPYEFEVEATVPGVDPMVMRMVKAPVLDERGRLVGIVTMGHDITERVEHERSLARMASDARDEYERARADYARLIRHRLANPLTIIEGAAHALLLDYSENRVNRELLGRLISEQVHRLALLDLQADRAGDEERELEALSKVDADEVLRAMQVFGAEFREIDGADPSTSRN